MIQKKIKTVWVSDIVDGEFESREEALNSERAVMGAYRAWNRENKSEPESLAEILRELNSRVENEQIKKSQNITSGGFKIRTIKRVKK